MDFTNLLIFGVLLVVSHISAEFAERPQESPNWQNSPPIMGAHTMPRPADSFSQAAADKVRPQVESRMGVPKLDVYEVIDYSTQPVAGINWRFKIRAGYNGQIIQVRVSASQPIGSQELSLTDIQKTD